jgi:hypothetical protein
MTRYYLQSIRSYMRILVVWGGKICIGYKSISVASEDTQIVRTLHPHMNLLVWETLQFVMFTRVQPLCNDPPHQCSVFSTSQWHWLAVMFQPDTMPVISFFLTLFYYHSILVSIFMFWHLESKRVSEQKSFILLSKFGVAASHTCGVRDH